MKRILLALSLFVVTPAMPVMAAPAAPFMIAEREPEVDQAISEGKAAMETGNYEQALSSFQDAASMAPDDPEIQAMVAEAQAKACEHYVKRGHELIAAKDYPRAINVFDNALDIDPDNADAQKGRKLAEAWPKADAYVKEAKARLAKREFAHAVAYFQKAYDLTADPAIKKELDEAKKRK